MAWRERMAITVETYFERRTLDTAGQTVERHYRRARWEPPDTAETRRRVAKTAAPLLRALALALAPALGRLAVRVLAPRVLAAPHAARQLRPSGRGAGRAPLALPPGAARPEDRRGSPPHGG